MSTARVVRFILGVIVSAILLAIILPLAGIPKSHFLPPAWIYAKADGITRGYVTAKYYDVTNNPFDVGGRQYFIKYQFRAKSPGPKGEPDGGPPQVYHGITRLMDKGIYDNVAIAIDRNEAAKMHSKQDIPAYPGQIVRVRYEKTYPYINGIDAPWGGKNIGEGSNISSGWILWVVVTLILGYIFMMLFERFSNKENI